MQNGHLASKRAIFDFDFRFLSSPIHMTIIVCIVLALWRSSGSNLCILPRSNQTQWRVRSHWKAKKKQFSVVACLQFLAFSPIAAMTEWIKLYFVISRCWLLAGGGRTFPHFSLNYMLTIHIMTPFSTTATMKTKTASDAHEEMDRAGAVPTANVMACTDTDWPVIYIWR